MKEHPILFSSPMVRAILEGRKTQTRRVLNPQPEFNQVHDYKGKRLYDGENRRWCWKEFVASDYWSIGWEQEILPHLDIKVGDLLWVRETWAKQENQLSDSFIDSRIIYKADGTGKAIDNGTELPWRPSIFMPRRFSRLTLRVTECRVERLQEISCEDAWAEGIPCTAWSNDDWVDADGFYATERQRDQLYLEQYEELWDSINTKKHPWESNPWVKVIGFEVVK